MTNAVKAAVVAAVNAVLAVIESFDVYSLSDEQRGAILGLVNAGFLVWIALTYKASPKRIPDA